MELSDKWVKENKGKRFDVKMNGREDLKNISFFMSQGGSICYMNSRQKRRGQLFSYWDMEEVIELDPKPLPTPKGNANTLLRRTHENAWDNLQKHFYEITKGAEPNTDFKYHFEDKLKFRSLTSLFNKRIINELKDAFDNKTNYRQSIQAKNNSGRDISVSTELGKDGIFRAWFSSEYAGCLNGDYYLLLNPTTAVFYEKD